MSLYCSFFIDLKNNYKNKKAMKEYESGVINDLCATQKKKKNKTKHFLKKVMEKAD